MTNQRKARTFKRLVSDLFVPQLPLWIGLLAMLATLSSLGAGLMADDYGILLTVRGGSRVYEHMHLSPLDLFRFFDGNPENARGLMDVGVLPWWINPEIKAAFWRPVTSLSHFVDFRFWGNRIWLMHLHSVLLYGIVAGLAAALYRRWCGATGIAVLAAVLYALDHTHGVPVGWLANRNAVLAALFGFLALWAHDRWRRDAWRAGPFVATGALVLSLLSGEAGIATCAYLFAHAIFLDRERLPKALLCLVPYAITVVIWRIVWAVLGYGTDGIGLYVDPLHDPLGFARALIERMPILLLSQWALPPAEVSLLLGPAAQVMHWMFALVFILVVAVVCHPVLRHKRVAGFFLSGMLLALLPVCAAFPHDRMLMFVGLGAMGLIGVIIREALGRPSRLWPKWPLRILAVGLAGLFLILHLVVSPVFLTLRAAFPMGQLDQIEKLHLLRPLEAGDEDRDYVIVNPVEPFLSSASLAMRETKGLGLPRSMRVLAPGLDGMTIHRIDDRTLLIRPGKGFFSGFFNRMVHEEDYRMRVGDRVELRGMKVEVTHVSPEGHPMEAQFIFDAPLEDESIRWFRWDGKGYIPFDLPMAAKRIDL